MLDSNLGSIGGVPEDVLPKSATVLTCLSLALLAASPSPASAAPGEYAVAVCTASSNTGGGVPTELPNGTFEGSGLFYEHSAHVQVGECNAGVVSLSFSGAPFSELTHSGWKLIAPDGTRIEKLGMLEIFNQDPVNQGPTKQFTLLQWARTASTPTKTVRIDEYTDETFFINTVEKRSAAIHAPIASSTLTCRNGFICGGIQFPVQFSVVTENLGASVLDEFLPGVSGPTLASRTLRGTVDVGFKAVDKGSGITKVELVELDGDQKKTLASMSDDNGGKCVTTPTGSYKFMQPCKLEIDSSFSLDSTKLTEGQHELEILATDASGQTRETTPLAVLVHNSPTNLARPQIVGPATVGTNLKATPGEWGGDPTSFAFRWFRCPGNVRGEEEVQSCRAIPGATSAEYTVGGEDLEQRELVEVTATNSSGSDTRLSFPTDLIEKPRVEPPPGPKKPLITHLRLSRKRFRVGSTLSKKGRRASVLAFSCNRAGEVSIVIRQVRPHRKPKSLGKLVAKVKRGPSRLLLSGEIGKHRRLKPGRYEAVVRVTDQKGTTSDPAGVRFTIIKG